MSSQLNFEIENQIITRTDSFQPVAKSQNYLKASFTFSEDWGSDDKIAIFKTGGKSYEVILDAEGECVVPWEALTRVGNVYVSAYSGDRVTASVAKVPIIKTGYVDDPTSTEDPSIDIYQQLKAQIQDVQDEIPEIVDDVLSNTKLSDFDNDVGFITENDIPTPDWEAISTDDGYIANKPDLMSGSGIGSVQNSQTTASGNYSHAEGNSTTASMGSSHAEGTLTTASAPSAHAEGNSTTASGHNAHAEGSGSVASGSNSHAEGRKTIAKHLNQHVGGAFNIPDPSTAGTSSAGTYIEIIGNGNAEDARSNARTLDWSGNEWLSGNLKIGGTGYTDANAKEIATKEYVDDAIADIPTESEIDDTAGAGDTDKTWSADKITSELANAGSVQDVQVNGTSVVSQGIASITITEVQTVQVSGTTPTIVANQNTRYVCGEIVSLDFTPSAEGICDVMFTSGSTVTVLTLPSTVRMPEWWEGPEAGYTYEINVVDGIYGVVTSWAV